MLVVALLIALPASVLLYYMSLHVETALLERNIRRLRHEEELLLKKNSALRKEIRRTTYRGAETVERLPAADRIVHIRLGPKTNPEGRPR